MTRVRVEPRSFDQGRCKNNNEAILIICNAIIIIIVVIFINVLDLVNH